MPKCSLCLLPGVEAVAAHGMMWARWRALLRLDDVACRNDIRPRAVSSAKRTDPRRYHLGFADLRRRHRGGRRGDRDPAATHRRPTRRASRVRSLHLTNADVLLPEHEAQPGPDVGDLVDGHRRDALRHVDTHSRRFRPGAVGPDGPIGRDVGLDRGRLVVRRVGGRAAARRVRAAPPGRGGAVPGFRRGGLAARLPHAGPTAAAGRTDRGAEDVGRARGRR